MNGLRFSNEKNLCAPSIELTSARRRAVMKILKKATAGVVD